MSQDFNVGWVQVEGGASPAEIKEITDELATASSAWTWAKIEPDVQALLDEVFDSLPEELINLYLTHPNLTIRTAAVRWKERQ
jgi:hypothetical protein